jgi:hypothetical protein
MKWEDRPVFGLTTDVAETGTFEEETFECTLNLTRPSRAAFNTLSSDDGLLTALPARRGEGRGRTDGRAPPELLRVSTAA